MNKMFKYLIIINTYLLTDMRLALQNSQIQEQGISIQLKIRNLPWLVYLLSSHFLKYFHYFGSGEKQNKTKTANFVQFIAEVILNPDRQWKTDP